MLSNTIFRLYRHQWLDVRLAKMNDYVSKPIQVKELQMMLEKFGQRVMARAAKT
jgi:CheY-like chemotaxis protein